MMEDGAAKDRWLSKSQVTPVIYLTIALSWIIVWTIYCIVIAIVEPIASVNALTEYNKPTTQWLVHASQVWLDPKTGFTVPKAVTFLFY